MVGSCCPQTSAKHRSPQETRRGCRLRLAERNAVLFAPLDGDLPKFGLLEPIPSVPQVVFGKQAFEQPKGACTANAAVEIISHPCVSQCFGEAVHDGPLVDIELAG